MKIICFLNVPNSFYIISILKIYVLQPLVFMTMRKITFAFSALVYYVSLPIDSGFLRIFHLRLPEIFVRT